MADKTHIEWTDATWNVINGCTVVSPGCTNCYAMRLAATRLKDSASRAGLARMHNGHPQWTGEVSLNKRVSLDPVRWQRQRRIFVCAHGDLFHEAVPDHWIDFVFNVMFLAPQHTYQVLTKRPERMREYMQIVLDETEEQTAYRFGASMVHAGLEDTPKDKLPLIQWPPQNAWLGTSVEDQERAVERIPLLLETPAAVRWLSCEPLLGPLEIGRWLAIHKHWRSGDSLPSAPWHPPYPKHWYEPQALVLAGYKRPLHWVVAGGESGPGARPMHPDWARSLRDQCAAASVPFHFKQWGDWLPRCMPVGRDDESVHIHNAANAERGWLNSDGRYAGIVDEPEETAELMVRVGKRTAGRLLDGVQHDGYPT